MKKIIFFWISIILITSCKKEEGNEPLPALSDTPLIELVGVSSTSINQFDDVTITVKYTDGDGDLGHSDANENSIFVTDMRDIQLFHQFHLQPLTPDGQSFAIEGNLKIKIENIILLNQSSTTESTTFQVFIRDRAGNKSNVVTTSNIRISK